MSFIPKLPPMKRFLIASALVVFIGSVHVQAQVARETALRPKQEIKLGDLLYAQGHYYSAVGHYAEAVRELGGGRDMKRTGQYRYAMYWLAMSYLQGRDYENAVRHFEAFHEIGPGTKDKPERFEKENEEIYELSGFYFGEALKHVERYEDAIGQYEAFIARYDYDDKEVWQRRVDNAIAGARLGIEWADRTNKVKVRPLGPGVNTRYTETNPVPVGDSMLIYSALRSNDLIFIDRGEDVPPSRLYVSTLGEEGTWSKGRELPELINDEEASTGNAAYSEDGQRMYFCKCYETDVDEVLCNLWLSEVKDGKWQEPVKLNEEINSDKYTATQPTVRTAGDGVDIVYFVSDRPGGEGGMDIWYFLRTPRGNVRGPRAVKRGINTPGDELYPYFDNATGRMYFSSNGLPSMGGFDIFMALEDSTLGWREPINLGRPHNTPADDLAYTRMDGEGGRGYLASNRTGSTPVDMGFTGDDIFYFEDFKYGLEGLVLRDSDEGMLPAGESVVTLYRIYDDGTEEIISVDSNALEDYFFRLEPDADFRVEVEKPGFSTQVEFVSTRDLPMEDTLQRNLVVDRTMVSCTGKVFNAEDTETLDPLDGAFVTLYDLSGGQQNQMGLARITPTDQAFDFRVSTERSYRLEVSKDGFFKGIYEFETTDVPDEVQNVCEDQFIMKIEKDKSYELENIEYDFNSSTLRDQSLDVLEMLVTLMQENPSLIIELGAHTDSKGSAGYNLQLSQDRAQSCVDYLVERGISEDRLVAKGYGESVPIAPNENEDGSDNPEGRQRNRRTEFKVIGEL